MTTVTFQNGRKLTFNPIYFANEFNLNIYFNLSNKYAVLKKAAYSLLKGGRRF